MGNSCATSNVTSLYNIQQYVTLAKVHPHGEAIQPPRFTCSSPKKLTCTHCSLVICCRMHPRLFVSIGLGCNVFCTPLCLFCKMPTCQRKTKTAGRKMLRCLIAPHRALTWVASLFFITSGGANTSAASRPPAPVNHLAFLSLPLMSNHLN